MFLKTYGRAQVYSQLTGNIQNVPLQLNNTLLVEIIQPVVMRSCRTRRLKVRSQTKRTWIAEVQRVQEPGRKISEIFWVQIFTEKFLVRLFRQYR